MPRLVDIRRYCVKCSSRAGFELVDDLRKVSYGIYCKSCGRKESRRMHEAESKSRRELHIGSLLEEIRARKV